MASRAMDVGQAVGTRAKETSARESWAARLARWWWAGWLRYARVLAEAEGWGGHR